MYRFVDDNELQKVDMGGGDWIKIPAKLSYGFVAQFGDMKKDVEADKSKVMDFLSKLIREWSFTVAPDSDEIAPITKENLVRLDLGTINAMVAAITPLMSIEKKDSAA